MVTWIQAWISRSRANNVSYIQMRNMHNAGSDIIAFGEIRFYRKISCPNRVRLCSLDPACSVCWPTLGRNET